MAKVGRRGEIREEGLFGRTQAGSTLGSQVMDFGGQPINASNVLMAYTPQITTTSSGNTGSVSYAASSVLRQ